MGDKLVASKTGTAVKYLHTNYLGSVQGESVLFGQEPTRMHYQPFGDSIETPRDDVGFTGHKYDTELGLNYMQARYYDPVVGRFYANDPVGFSDVHNFNRYTYANNNPNRYVDPNGEAAKLVKSLYNVVKKASKNGWDFKKAGKDEIAGFIDNVMTLADGQWTVDDVYATIDLVTGFGDEAKKAAKVVNTSVRKDLYPTRARKSTVEKAKNNSRDANGNIVCDKCKDAVPESQVTMQHEPALVDTHNSLGWNTDQPTRNNLYNETITGVNCRKCQAQEGGSMKKKYRRDTGPNFKPRKKRRR